MFKPNTQFEHNKHSYYVVRDHIVASDNDNNEFDANHFTSGGKKITDSLEVSFINDYKITEKNNPIGFWQTILNNHNFDYSVNFKYKFEIDEEPYLISFALGKGITLYADINLVDIDGFDDIDIDFDSFNNFEVIKTRQQIKQDKSRFWRNAILLHTVFYVLFIGGIFAYYQYKTSTFSEINKTLLSMQSKVSDLELNIDRVKDNTIASGVTSQQHINNLLRIMSSVSAQSKIDLTQSLALITISLDDLDRVRHLAKSNHIVIKIDRNFSKNTVNVAWEVRGN